MKPFLGINLNKNLAKKGTIIALALAVVIGLSYFGGSEEYLNISIIDKLMSACNSGACTGDINCDRESCGSHTENSTTTCIQNAKDDAFNSPGEYDFGGGINKHYNAAGVKDYETHIPPSDTHYISGCPQPDNNCDNHREYYNNNIACGECCGHLNVNGDPVCLGH